MLTISKQNGKLHEIADKLGWKHVQVVAVDLPAGFTCPAAALCQTFANRRTGRQTKGKKQEFSCFASDLEARYTNVRNAHWHNFDCIRPLLRDVQAMADLIEASLFPPIHPKSRKLPVKVVRIHASGDFFSKSYYEAWVEVTRRRPNVLFFAYTKEYPLMKEYRPPNFALTLSKGGDYDDIARAEGYFQEEERGDDGKHPSCTVVKDAKEAAKLGLPVACATPTSPDDLEYIVANRSFAIILH